MFGSRLREIAGADLPESATKNEREYRGKLESRFIPELLAFADEMAKVGDAAERERLANAAGRFLAWMVSEHAKEAERNGLEDAARKRATIEAELLREAGIKPN